MSSSTCALFMVAGLTILRWCSTRRQSAKWAPTWISRKCCPMRFPLRAGGPARHHRRGLLARSCRTCRNGECGAALYRQRHYAGFINPNPASGCAAPQLCGVVSWSLASRSLGRNLDQRRGAMIVRLGRLRASNVIKWYWWRFNGFGYFWGMAVGIGSAMLVLLPFAAPWQAQL